jgi:protein-ribulosamine 3-kinase
MPPEIDPALLRALSLDSSNTSIHAHGGSGFASTFRLTTPTTSIFVKTASGPESAVMFEGEHASLNAIHSAIPSLCPKSFAWGKMDAAGDKYFLATEFLDLGSSGRRSSSSKGGSGQSLAQKLAKLHTTPAPITEGYQTPMFGFPVTTCCGDTPQDNTFEASWADFFGKHRLLAILDRSEKRNGKDPQLRKVVEKTVAQVVPRLLGDGHLGGKEGIKPVVVHGDLWSGNKGRGTLIGRDASHPDQARGAVEEVIFDPSASYAHHEFEQGIMQMFGGFSPSMMKEYHSLCPVTEPVSEHEDRVALYESYHHLNHFSIFGGGYKSSAMKILERLNRNYGS